MEECNRESEFQLDLTLPARRMTGVEELEESHEINGRAYFLSGDGITYTIAGYPHVMDAYHVTDISITNDTCAVYGIRVGDALEDAEAILSEWGYVLDRSYPDGELYRKYDVTIELSAEEHGRVDSICVSVDIIDETLIDF